MYKVLEFTKPVYQAGETARMIGVTTEMLRNYEDSGKSKFFRSSGGHRLIEKEELLRFLDSKGLLLDDTIQEKRDVIYAHVFKFYCIELTDYRSRYAPITVFTGF